MELSLKFNNHHFLITGPSRLHSFSCRATNNTMANNTSRKNNLYQVLSLSSENVGHEEIKKAYRKLARQYQPDVRPASVKEESTRQFLEIQEAYETLSDPASRLAYDYELSTANSSRRQRRSQCSSSSRVVWEMQLHGLKERSSVRMERKGYY